MGHGDVVVALVAPRPHEQRKVQRAVPDARPDILAVAGGEVDPEARIRGAEFADRPGHRLEGDGFAGADGERSGEPLVAVGADFVARALGERDDVVRAAQQQRAPFRRLDAARAPHEERPDSWFQHIALEVPGTGGRNEWLEPVDDAAYTEAIRPPAIVYFTHDISPAGLEKAYKALGRPLEGRKVAVKISTGEAGNNHYLKPALIGSLVQALQGDIVECNTAYGGSRQETPKHRQTIADHGFDDIAKVVIMDEFAETELPTPAGSVHLKSDRVGAALTNYTGSSDPKTSASLRARMEKQLGPHILDHAEALGYGTKSYRLVSLDGNEPPSTKRVD